SASFHIGPTIGSLAGCLSPSVAARPRRRIMRKANSSRWRSMITSV
ncbi:MAG: hypothetical protein, partial [Olavius algarvensis Gamma 1 endosymbiont]